MKIEFVAFNNEDKGAVTIDWVMLTGLLVGLGVSLTAAIGPTLNSQGAEMVDRANISTVF